MAKNVFRVKRSEDDQFYSTIENVRGETKYTSETVHNHKDCVKTVNSVVREGDKVIDETGLGKPKATKPKAVKSKKKNAKSKS